MKIGKREQIILEQLGSDRISGRALREKVKQCGRLNLSAPRFYIIMSKMEDAKLVSGENVPKALEGETIKERFYRAIL